MVFFFSEKKTNITSFLFVNFTSWIPVLLIFLSAPYLYFTLAVAIKHVLFTDYIIFFFFVDQQNWVWKRGAKQPTCYNNAPFIQKVNSERIDVRLFHSHYVCVFVCVCMCMCACKYQRVHDGNLYESLLSLCQMISKIEIRLWILVVSDSIHWAILLDT